MTATRPRHHGKRAFCALLAITSAACAAGGPDPGWRLVVIPSFERPALHRNIPGSDTAILAAMVAHPVLVNRPIVRTPKGAALCRPSEKVFDLLEQAPDRFVKEDGQVV